MPAATSRYKTPEKCPSCSNGHGFSIMAADKSAKCPCGAVFYYRHPGRLQRFPPVVCIGHDASSRSCYVQEIKVVWIDDYADGGLTLI